MTSLRAPCVMEASVAPAAARISRRDRTIDGVVVTLAIVAGTVYREPLAFMRPQLWAEDGPIFFVDGYTAGWAAILRPYAGYYELYQRVVAAICVHLPVATIATAFTVGNVLAQVGVGWLCVSRRVAAPRWVRVAMGAAVTLAPAQNEVFNKLVNSQWILALAPLVVLAYEPPRSRWQAAFDLVVVVLAGLSGPFSIVYVPVFAANAVLRRQAHAWGLFTANLACAIVQSLHVSYTKVAGAPASLVDYLRVANGAFGHTVAGSWGRPAPAGLATNVLLLAVAVILLVALATRAVSSRRWASLLILAAGLGVFGASLYSFRHDPIPLITNGDRYWYVPTVSLAWAALTSWSSAQPPWRQPLPLVLLVAMLAAFLQDPHSPPLSATNRNWSEASRCIGKTHPCVIPIDPGGWTFTVP